MPKMKERPECIAVDCRNVQYARERCYKHYAYWYKYNKWPPTKPEILEKREREKAAARKAAGVRR